MVSVNVQRMKKIDVREYEKDELGNAFLVLVIDCEGGGQTSIFINNPADLDLLKQAIKKAENSTVWED